jgi:hypothetical protein
MRRVSSAVVALLSVSIACAAAGCASSEKEAPASARQRGLSRRTGIIIPEGGQYDVSAVPPADWADDGMQEGEQVYELNSPTAAGVITVKDMTGREIFVVSDVPPGTTVRIDGQRLEVVPPRR